MAKEDKNIATEAKGAEAATKDDKSIIDPKYREKYKEPDWLGQIIAEVSTKTKKKTIKKTVGEGDDAKEVEETKTVNDGIDVDQMFALAKGNNLDVSKYESAERNHGFEGRMRMTIRNMLQAAVKRRHGLYVGSKWREADAAWLQAKNAPEAPTEKKDGTKIPKAKAPKEEAPAE